MSIERFGFFSKNERLSQRNRFNKADEDDDNNYDDAAEPVQETRWLKELDGGSPYTGAASSSVNMVQPPPPAPPAAKTKPSSNPTAIKPSARQPSTPPTKRARVEQFVSRDQAIARDPRYMAENWATFERSAEVWADYLQDRGADSHSVAGLFLLAQMSDVGYKRANSIVYKVVKKDGDSQHITNVSAFIHSCVKTARHQIENNTD